MRLCAMRIYNSLRQILLWVRWGTSALRNSVVRFGTDPNNLNRTAKSSAKVYQHEVKLTGLRRQLLYYYSVGYHNSAGAHVC